MSLKVTLLIIHLFTSFTLLANVPTGPYKSTSHAHIGQKVIHLLDNMTVGSVQSVVGLGHIAVYAIGKPISKSESIELSFHNPSNEIAQIRMHEPVVNAGAYSLGLVQIGEGWVDHEGGHSTQSAALGPLYLPVVALTYLLEGSCCGTMEIWADIEGDDAEFMNTQQVQVGIGQFKLDGEAYTYLSLKLSLDQSQYVDGDEMKRIKHYEWFKSNVAIPLYERAEKHSQEVPLFFEISLLEKSIQLHNKLNKFFLSTEQIYAKLENDPVLKRMHFNALKWKSSFGVNYDFSKINTQVAAYIGVNAGLSFFGNRSDRPVLFNFQDSFRAALTGGFQVGMNVNLFDYININSELGRNYNTFGEKFTTFQSSLTNQKRNPFKNIGFIQYLEFGIEHKYESVRISATEQLTSHRVDALLGVRF